MYLSEFWSKYGDILVSSIFILASIFLLVALIVNMGKKHTGKKLYLIGGVILFLTLVSINLIMIKDYRVALGQDATTIFPIANVLLYNAFIIILFVGLGYFLTKKKDRIKEKTTVSNVATLGLLIALASVLMLFGLPYPMPGFSFLKIEVSALIYFMVLLWFGPKQTIIVVLLTNIVHGIMPTLGETKIPFLDEMVNVVAVIAFLTPAYIINRKLSNNEVPNKFNVIISAILGAVFTTIFMVLYNFYINLPLIYSWPMDFGQVVYVFGVFNIIKWSLVSIVVVLLYEKIYNLKKQILRENDN